LFFGSSHESQQRGLFIAAVLFFAATAAHAQWSPDPTAETKRILLWCNGAPGALGIANEDPGRATTVDAGFADSTFVSGLDLLPWVL
jgi:hypothetical protein